MKNREALGSWIRRFLMEYLVGERNLARNTQQSYRDAVRLLVVFTAAKAHKKVDELLIPDIDADLLRAFLRHIEEKRKCSVSSRNQRLAAIHALAGFIAERCPEYQDWCAQLRSQVQAYSPHTSLLSREAGNRRFTGGPKCGHKTRLSGSSNTAFSLQLGSTGRRSCKTVHRRPQPTQRHRRYVVFGVSSRQRRQGSYLSALGIHNRDAEEPRCRAGWQGARVPQSPLGAANTLRHP